MPRRREMTLDCLRFEWSPAGTAATVRAAELTRPMAYEIARVLMLLIERTQPEGALPGAAPSIAIIADRTGLTEHDARTAVHDLEPTGLVMRQRERHGRHPADARWALGYELAPCGEIRGPGRRPRLVKLALLVEPDVPCGDLMDVLLRQAGVLAVQATNSTEALQVLEHIGFDLVLVDSGVAVGDHASEALVPAIRAAACNHVVLLRRPDVPADVQYRGSGFQLALAKPFSEREFEAMLTYVGLANTIALPRSG